MLSPERIDLIDVDRIFVINDKADQDALKKFKLFTNLPAVKNGKVSYLLDSEGPAIGAAMSQGTLLSLPYAIDELVKSVGSRCDASTDRRGVTPRASTLRTATGREATRWVAAHCREVPWLTTATVLTTVAGAALQVLPVLLLGRVVDGVVEGESALDPGHDRGADGGRRAARRGGHRGVDLPDRAAGRGSARAAAGRRRPGGARDAERTDRAGRPGRRALPGR